jgi:hypothetical protein
VARPDLRYRPLYVSRNLAGHALFAECNPGGGTDCPCTEADVALRALIDHGEVTSNVAVTHTYVNALGYQKWVEIMPDGNPVSLGIYVYAGQFRLPILPLADLSQHENGQAMHLMIQLWDGRDVLFPAGGATLEGTIYWVLNPWQLDLGHVQVYTGSNPIVLVETGLILQPDLGWHTFELVVDLVGQRYVSLTITTESLATWPQGDCRDAFTWTVWFGDLALGSLDG